MFEHILFVPLRIPKPIVTASGRLRMAWQIRLVEVRLPV